jgi:hypothetical protein
MSADRSESPEEDSAAVARLSKELEDAEAALQRVTAENAELERALGEPAGARKAARGASKRSPGGYRGPDVRAVMETAIAEVNGAVASIDIDNAMLRSRLDEKGAVRDSARRWRTIGRVTLLLVALFTVLALWQSPTALGPLMLILVTTATGLYALHGWFVVFSTLPRYRIARRVLAKEPKPLAGAPAGRSIMIRGTVVGRDTAFDAWYPDGEHAVWQDVRVIDTRGWGSRNRREQVAHRHRETAELQIADAAGDRVRVEPAGAEVVPEELSCSATRLSRPGRRELDAIGDILGDRDELTIEIELIRLGATVLVQGRLSDDPEPVLRGTPKAPLQMVVLDDEGLDGATRMFNNGLRIGVVYAAITTVACFALVELLAKHR